MVQDYKEAALNAMETDFDGVRLYGWTDEYGGNIENCNRFVLEVMRRWYK